MAGVPAIDGAHVETAARRMVGDPDAQLLDWTLAAMPHVGIIGTTGGLHLVTGQVRSRDDEAPFTCVLKVLTRPPGDECEPPASWCYWRREAAFYGSELPADIPGPLRAPRAFAVLDREREAHVWMELVEAEPRRWGIEEFRLAAHAAGVSAGAYLTGRPLPEAPWLVRGFLRSILGAGGIWARVMDAQAGEAWGSSLTQAFGDETRRRVLRLWAEREALLAVAESLPQVLGHGDLHPRNLLLRAGEVVGLDWGFCGPAPLGGDLADLVNLPAWFCDLGLDERPGVEQAAFEAYGAGLREAGWDGDPRLVRLGYAMHAALRMGACMPGWAWLMLGPERERSSEVMFGRPVAAILETWIALARTYLDLGDEARSLAAELGLARA